MVEKEQTVVVDGNQPDEEVNAPPTVEELQKDRDYWKSEAGRKEQVIVDTKSENKRLQRQGGSKAEMDALNKRFDSQEEFLAQVLDDMTLRVSGEEIPAQQRKTYSQQLAERKAQVPEPKADPDTQKLINYCDAMDLHLDYEDFDGCDPVVKEALGEGRSMREGLKYLKEKMKPKDADVDKVVSEKLNLALEQKLKDMGLTTAGAGSPGGSSGRSFTRQQIDDMSMEEYREKKAEINEAIRQGKVK